LLGEYEWLIYGLQVSHLSDGDQFNNLNNDDIENPRDHGLGGRRYGLSGNPTSWILFLNHLSVTGTLTTLMSLTAMSTDRIAAGWNLQTLRLKAA